MRPPSIQLLNPAFEIPSSSTKRNSLFAYPPPPPPPRRCVRFTPDTKQYDGPTVAKARPERVICLGRPDVEMADGGWEIVTEDDGDEDDGGGMLWPEDEEWEMDEAYKWQVVKWMPRQWALELVYELLERRTNKCRELVLWDPKMQPWRVVSQPPVTIISDKKHHHETTDLLLPPLPKKQKRAVLRVHELDNNNNNRNNPDQETVNIHWRLNATYVGTTTNNNTNNITTPKKRGGPRSPTPSQASREHLDKKARLSTVHGHRYRKADVIAGVRVTRRSGKTTA